MKQAITFMFILSVFFSLQGLTRIVAQDGTGDYETISVAILDLNATTTDTCNNLIVTPGIYHETSSMEWVSDNGLASDIHLWIRGTDLNICVVDMGHDPGIDLDSPGFIFSGPDVSMYDKISGLTIQNADPGICILAGEMQVYNCQFLSCVQGTIYGSLVSEYQNGSAIYCTSGLDLSYCSFRNNECHPMNLISETTGYGGSIYLQTQDVYGVNISNCYFDNGYAVQGGAIYADGYDFLTITDCQFINLSSDEGGALHITETDELNIERNVISNCAIDSNSGQYSAGYIHNCPNIAFTGNTVCWSDFSFWYYTNITLGIDNDVLTGSFEMANNTFYRNYEQTAVWIDLDSLQQTPIITNNIADWNRIGFDVSISDFSFQYNLLVRNTTHVEGFTPDDTNLINIIPLYDDPSAAYGEGLTPQWNASNKSPVIDAGNPGYADPDNTYSDIGAKRAINHRQQSYGVIEGHAGQGELYYNWVCFPVTDNIYIPDIEPENFFQPLETSLVELLWEGGGAEVNFEDEWIYPDAENVVPVNGYKISVDDEVVMWKSGFLADPNQEIFLTDEPEPQWIGYFLEQSQKPLDALSGVLENLTQIKHHDWCLTYVEGWGWLGGSSYTLNFGDMVEITCTHECSFRWTDNLIPSGERTKGTTTLYTVQENPEYIPVYMDLSAYENDLPQEVGMYADGALIGASVVDGTQPQINAYVEDIEEIENCEITFELHYGLRGSVERCSSYEAKSAANDGFRETSQLFSSASHYYLVRPGSDHHQTVPVPPAKLALSNYPNPFNPETTFHFSLPVKGDVEMKIYNTRGQLVRMLVNTEYEAGVHEIVWDGKNDLGQAVGSGVYLTRLSSNQRELCHRVLLLK